MCFNNSPYCIFVGCCLTFSTGKIGQLKTVEVLLAIFVIYPYSLVYTILLAVLLGISYKIQIGLGYSNRPKGAGRGSQKPTAGWPGQEADWRSRGQGCWVGESIGRLYGRLADIKLAVCVRAEPSCWQLARPSADSSKHARPHGRRCCFTPPSWRGDSSNWSSAARPARPWPSSQARLCVFASVAMQKITFSATN